MYLGIDVGTSGVKAVLIDAQQNIIATSTERLTVIQDKPLYSEQNPEDWYQATIKSILQIKAKFPTELSFLKSIGLTGQMHGAVCLDKNGDILRPAILWNDGRSYRECDELMSCCPDFEELGGNKLMPGFTAPKLLWIKKNEPDIFNKIDKVLLPKDYIRYRLTHEFSTDMSDASGTLWLDIKKRRWSSSMLNACGLEEKNMPRLQEGTECSGFLSKEILSMLGINNSVKVVAGASDNAAGALSMGIYKPGDAMISLGTSGVYFTPTQKVSINSEKGLHTFCHAIEGTWHHMGVILSAASALGWWMQISKETSEKKIIDLAKGYNSNHLPLFLPYLSGERTPHNDPFAKASFIGLTHGTTNSEMTQAVLEGVAFAIADCERIITETGSNIKNVSVIGGGSKSLYWGSIISSILNRPLSYHFEASIGPSFGAARLAIYEDLNASLEDVFIVPKVEKIVQPEQILKEQLNKRINVYRQAYSQLKHIFREQEDYRE